MLPRLGIDFEFLVLFLYFRQHEENYTMSEKEILQDIVAYCPAVAGVTGAMPAKDVQRLIGNYLCKTHNLGQSYKLKANWPTLWIFGIRKDSSKERF